jgi:hypothetical protein
VRSADCLGYFFTGHVFIFCCLVTEAVLLAALVCGVSKKFDEWYQKTNKTEDTNKLTLLAFKIIAVLHNTLLAMFIKLLETVSKGLFRNRSQNRCHTFLDCCHVCKTCAFHDALQAEKQKEVHPPIILKANKVNLFVSSVSFVF